LHHNECHNIEGVLHRIHIAIIPAQTNQYSALQ